MITNHAREMAAKFMQIPPPQLSEADALFIAGFLEGIADLLDERARRIRELEELLKAKA